MSLNSNGGMARISPPRDGFDEETGLRIITLEEIEDHDSPDDAWMCIYDKVYDVTKFFDEVRKNDAL